MAILREAHSDIPPQLEEMAKLSGGGVGGRGEYYSVILGHLLTIFWVRMTMQGEGVVEVMEADRAQGLPEGLGKVMPIKGGDMSVYVCVS